VDFWFIVGNRRPKLIAEVRWKGYKSAISA
jgi:hypothetical protein